MVQDRLDELVGTLLDRHRIVCVTATAGSGKTTAVAQTARTLGRPIAWLSVDGTPAVPDVLLAYLEAALAPVAEACDRTPDPWDSFQQTREAYRQMAKAGFTKGFIPKEYGGLGLSTVDLAIAAEELARHDLNVPTLLVASGAGLWHVIHNGTPEQKERFLRPFAEDEEGDLLAVYAFTDEAGGANFDSADPAAGMQTFARRDGDESLAVVMVPGDLPGITVLDVYDKMGCRGIVSPRVRFKNVRVPAANMIGTPGKAGMESITRAFS
ncbi:acyl-CoA dehydrogenase family protein [Pseudonocardia asaccharolytica]|uniref:acyl-CoA dehydrogenase family protein n=1 Tax=Pseudonocardia asaccharolytica TaxID=54010 RepID=UPI0004125B04|nr:acyl-CoA dehydrogenase family protein [Pseudonocardia asaccharolytica]